MICFSSNVCGFDQERLDLFNKIGLTTLKKNNIEPKVFIDKEKRKTKNPCWSAARENWLWLAEQEAEYVGFLADDFEYFDSMSDDINRMINTYPNSAISFFQPAILGQRFFIKNDLEMNYRNGEILWGGTIIIPRKFVKKMIYWCDNIEVVSADDDKIAFALSIMGIKSFSPGRNHAFHYGAFLESTIPTNTFMDEQTLIIRANMRSGKSRDFAHGYCKKYLFNDYKDI